MATIHIGNRTFETYQRVRIKNIKDPGKKNQDADMNSKTGVLVHKHPDIPFGVIGVYLDREKGADFSVAANLNIGEFELIK